ncbi:MAG: hypothetical protein ACR2MU_01630 [Gaiellaceae bacterium]
MSEYHLIADLPLQIDGYLLERLERPVSSGFTRVTTVIRLEGGGHEGIGEDVTYDAGDQQLLQDEGRAHPLPGTWTLDTFSQRLDEMELFPRPPMMDAALQYRRWAFESAALDLALRQGGTTLAGALGRELRPIRFVSSLRLGEAPTAEPIRRRLERYPWLRFKLDPTGDWTDALVTELGELGVVDTVDFKGAYRGTPVDQAPDPELYARVVEGLPDAWIEDPALTAETEPALEPHRSRITWDAPIHSVADIEALPFAPRTINVKPSRFGPLRTLFETYAYLEERGIGAYGGGQFELGPGRGQIQYLASLFHPDGPNDVAPGGFNDSELGPGLPESPLDPCIASLGFRRDD